MKHLIYFVCVITLGFSQLQAQNAPDFTITDSDGVTHNLYEDYLDKGITVVIKFFFVDCPPCNFIAPSVQELYVEWGEGAYDVEFFELSTRSTDTNQDINGYKSEHSITFPGAGGEGDALAAIEPYSSGTFGTFFGTPSFAVIAPDRSVVYNTGGAGNAGKMENLSNAIADTGAVGMSTSTEPSIINVDIKDPFGNAVSDVDIFLEDANNPSNSYTITDTELVINDLATEYPGITNPVLRFSKSGSAIAQVSALDILLMRKHVLSIIPITDPQLVIAGDTNKDGSLTALDILNMRKLILNIITDFPSSNYQMQPEIVPLNLVAGETQDINVTSIKIGDLNGF